MFELKLTNIGHVFKEIRISRGLGLKELSDNDISVSSLSNFERGKTDISFTKFMKLIEKVNISYDEFMYMIKNDRVMQQKQFFKNLRKYVSEGDQEKILLLSKKEKKKFKETNLDFHLVNTSLVELHYNRMNNMKINSNLVKIISDYLLKQDHWFYYDVALINNSMFCVPYDDMVGLSKLVSKKLSWYIDMSEKHNEIVLLYINLSIYMIEKGDRNKSKRLIKTVVDYIKDTDWLYEINKIRFIQGMWEIRFGEVFVGEILCQSSINTFEQLKKEKIAASHKVYLENFISKYKKNCDDR